MISYEYLFKLKIRPVGSDGEIDHESTAPPMKVGVTGEVIATPFVSVNEPGL